jgi:lipoprotein signal peptidase
MMDTGAAIGRQRRPLTSEMVAFFLLLTAAALLLDWVTKSWALLNVSHSLMPLGAFTLGVARNDGFAFSAGSGALSPWVIVAARVGLLAVIALFAFRVASMNRLHAAGLALLFAGGLGNAADLVFRGGAVVDFIGVGPLTVASGGEPLYMHFVFNVADVLIFAGLIASAPVIGQMGRYARERLSAARPAEAESRSSSRA